MASFFFLSEKGDVSALLAPTHPSKFIWSVCVVFISPFAVLVVTTVIKGRGSRDVRTKGKDNREREGDQAS